MCFTTLYAADLPQETKQPSTEQAPAITPAPDTAPEAPPSYEATFVKMILSLGALLVLIFLTVWALKRLSSGRLRFMNQGMGIKILEKRPLSPKSVLYLVEIGGQKVLISESQLEVRKITDVSEVFEQNTD